jgi:Flp pilus assembly protein TadG
MRRERGSVTVEAVLLVPVLVLFVTFVVAAGRYGQAATTVRKAADTAAREASLVAVERMRTAATARVQAELERASEWCSGGNTEVRFTEESSVSRVTVRVTCTVSRRGLFSVLPVPRSVTAVSTEVIDVYSYR